jgi:predicted MFS family arabinose efflux permease
VNPPGRKATVLALGTAQTLAWGSSFYLPAMLAAPMAADLGLQAPAIYAALSMALIVSALCGPLAGRLIDSHGGRPVLMGANALFAAGLLLLAAAQGLVSLAAAWLLIGLAMGAGLYDAAFAALVRLYGRDARTAITGITLLAGFASTVGWPLTAVMESHWGWRGACAGWAALHLLVALPLNARVPRGVAAVTAPVPLDEAAGPARAAPARWLAPLLALVFALLSLVSTAIATHLPALLQAGGATRTAAVATASLVGPAQVAARLLEVVLLRRASPLWSARAAALGHPVGAGLFLALGTAGALPFAIVHGLGNGLLTIVRGTLPLALFGSQGYGARQGWIALPGRVLGGLSPWLFGVVIEHWGAGALWVSSAMCLTAFACLLALRVPQA